MPIYEFHCSKCGEDSEVLVRSSEWEGTQCPRCGSRKLSKKFSVFASSTTGESGGGEMACGRTPSSCGCCKSGAPHSH